MVVCDTDVLIEHFKGDGKTTAKLASIPFEQLAISSVTKMELFFGARNKRELSELKKALSSLQTVDISENVSRQATLLIEQYAKSHGLRIPDALIAATSIVSEARLFTYNRKDFRFIKGIVFYS